MEFHDGHGAGFVKWDALVQQLIESRLRSQWLAARGDEDPKKSRNQLHRVVEKEPVTTRYDTARKK
jgi:hypothetical protein